MSVQQTWWRCHGAEGGGDKKFCTTMHVYVVTAKPVIDGGWRGGWVVKPTFEIAQGTRGKQ